MSFQVLSFGNLRSDTLLVQMVDDHDLEGIEREFALIRELSGREDLCLKAVRVNSWYRDLSPWPAPAVFGNEDFGDGAEDTLAFLLKEVTGEPSGPTRSGVKKIYIGGYSLAGLFALWAGYRTDCFAGIAAASPSVWFPGFTDYMKEREICAGSVYLSLGDREERTRNAVMAKVGERIRDAYEVLQSAGVNCVLEWNEGNHFREPDVRTAKAFAWVLRSDG